MIFGYNGRDGVVTDKNGLIYMRARYYSPDMRRFVNADIVAGEISNAVTLNRFAYANGNPVSFVDPFGLWSLSDTWNSFTNWVEEKIIDPIVEAYNDIKPVIVETYNDAKDWVDEKIVQPVTTVINNIKQDIQNFDTGNESEEKVLKANYFSSYIGEFVLNLPIGNNAFSFGIIFMGTGVPDTYYNTVKHEYGHTVQYKNIGFWNYLTNIVIPSVTGYILENRNDLPYDYYTAPWEAEADHHGKVNPSDRVRSDPWTEEDGYYDFWDLVKAILNI